MDRDPGAGPPARHDGCAELRAAVPTLCSGAHDAQLAHAAATERARELRRRLTAAKHAQEAAEEAASTGRRSQEKEHAREAYRHERELATTDAQRREAVAVWAGALDRINRAARSARRLAARAHAEVVALEDGSQLADLAEKAARVRAESAEAACLEARVRLAACEERGEMPVPSTAPSRGAAAVRGVAGPAARGGIGHGAPTVMESLLSGDRRWLEWVAGTLGERTGRSAAHLALELRELLDAVLSTAASRGHVMVAGDHQFWNMLSGDEVRDTLGALARMGFQFEPAEGWHAGRAPLPADLSMALAYAGVDARSMRHLPTSAELRELPRWLAVDARALLAAEAPDLALDHVVRMLEHRADALGPLWDDWGQVRPILLGDPRTLGGRLG